jgi:hypothetical protein
MKWEIKKITVCKVYNDGIKVVSLDNTINLKHRI